MIRFSYFGGFKVHGITGLKWLESLAERIAVRSRKVPLVIRIGIIAIAVGLPIYWWATDSGLYYEVAEFQAGIFGGEHYVMLSVLVPMILLLFPGLALILLLASMVPGNNGDPSARR